MKIKSERSHVKVGDIIVCPKCHSEVYEVVNEIREGQVLLSNYFKAINGSKNLKDGQRFVCPQCYTPLFLNGGLPIKDNHEDLSS